MRLAVILDENKNEIDRINTSGGNIFKSYTFKLTEVTGDLFYIQEYNTDGDWRYRSNIDVSFNLPDIFLFYLLNIFIHQFFFLTDFPESLISDRLFFQMEN